MGTKDIENEIVKSNIEKLIGKEFLDALCDESIGGNAGEAHAGVNSYINSQGKIMEFSNYPTGEFYEKVQFGIDMSHLSSEPDNRNKARFIDGIYFYGAPQILEQEVGGIKIKGILFRHPDVERNKFKVSDQIVDYIFRAVKEVNKINGERK